jgi:hypothetical protein
MPDLFAFWQTVGVDARTLFWYDHNHHKEKHSVVWQGVVVM